MIRDVSGSDLGHGIIINQEARTIRDPRPVACGKAPRLLNEAVRLWFTVASGTVARSGSESFDGEMAGQGRASL